MKRVIFFLLLLFSSSGICSPFNISDDDSTIEHLISIVQDILLDSNNFDQNETVSRTANLIYNNTLEPLFDVLNDPLRKTSFINKGEIKPEFLRVWMSVEETNAYLVVEVKMDDIASNWHSIFFRQNEKQRWQIINWHKS